MQISHQTVATYQNKEVVLFRISNSSGAYIEVCNFGATLVSVVLPDKNGEMRNLILSYPNIEDYFTDTSYQGSTVGRVANRISNAQFTLNGKTYHLDKNDGENCNHSGSAGFNKRVFDYKITESSVTFYLHSKDGEGGFPGNLDFWVTYSFSENNKLSIDYKATTDQKTLFNPTNHAYFNLSGKRDSILDHTLQVYASAYLESNSKFLPTGKILPVEDSAFDFRAPHTIREMMNKKNDHMEGFNAYFIASDSKQIKHLATLKDTDSGFSVNVYSTLPGILVYTGDYLNGLHQPFEGVCLELQDYPDAPNFVDFPSIVLTFEKMYMESIIYTFPIKIKKYTRLFLPDIFFLLNLILIIYDS